MAYRLVIFNDIQGDSPIESLLKCDFYRMALC